MLFPCLRGGFGVGLSQVEHSACPSVDSGENVGYVSVHEGLPVPEHFGVGSVVEGLFSSLKS